MLASQRNMTEPRIIIAPQTYAYGLLRMFQGLSERTRPLLQIVHTVEEALSALGIRSPRIRAMVDACPTPDPRSLSTSWSWVCAA